MTITVTISNLSNEQSDVLNAVVDAANSSLKPDQEQYTIETFLSGLLDKSVDSYVKTAFNESLLRAGNKLSAAPYDLRIALIQQVEAI